MIIIHFTRGLLLCVAAAAMLHNVVGAQDTHLLAVPKVVELWHSLESLNNAIIPCLPTSPEMKVTLIKEDEELVPGNTYDHMQLGYDPTLGFILNHVTQLNSGTYTCHSKYNDKEDTIDYILVVVKGVPKIDKTKMSNSDIFCEVKKMCSFECHMTGYPLPDVEWYFQKCPNYPDCGESLITHLPRSMYETTVYAKDELSSLINLTANETGILYCNATNELGNSNHGIRLLLTDVPNGLAINGPPIIVDGDDITIECGASKFLFTEDFKWIQPGLSVTYSTATNDKNVFVTNNKTALSYRSFLTIKNITNAANGKYVCVPYGAYKEAETEQLHDLLLNDTYSMKSSTVSYSVLVHDQHIPVIQESSSSDSLNVIIGNRVQFECYIEKGLPQPTITWFHIGHRGELKLNKNNSKVLLRDENQILILKFTELGDEGKYVCRVLNKVGYDESTKSLHLIDENIELKYHGLIIFLIVLFILLGVLVISYTALHMKKLKKILSDAGLLHFEDDDDVSCTPDLKIEKQALNGPTSI